MKTSSFIIALTGASGCGKTYITERIVEYGIQLQKNGIAFQPKRHWKYTTRPYRDSELIDMAQIPKKEIDVKSVKAIPSDCEFRYRTYGDEYGFRKKDLQDYLGKGESPIIVVNDVKVIGELKKEFSDQVLSLFLFKEIIPDIETHKKTGQLRGGVSENEVHTRFQKAVELYRVFIENISQFDRVILNVPYEGIKENGESFEDIAKIQAEGVIWGVIEGKIPLNKEIVQKPKLFIVSGNAQSGKDDILRSVKNEGKLQADILIKHTSRREENGDEGEIICQLRPDQGLIKRYENEYNADMTQLDADYTFENYIKINKQICAEQHRKICGKTKECAFEEYCLKLFEEAKENAKCKIKDTYERFWEDLKEEIERMEKAKPYNPNIRTINKHIREIIKDEGKGEKASFLWRCIKDEVFNQNKKALPQDDDEAILKKYFEVNPEYIDLRELVSLNNKQYKKAIRDIQHKVPNRPENNSAFISHKNEAKDFVVYENNKKIYYGYEIGQYKKNWDIRNKHLVLTASLPNIFKICRDYLGYENVITAFTYSQISQEEHLKHSDGVIGTAKLQEYDDILRYAYHIADFDYALIFAETSLTNKNGGQKEALVDQMYRLFKYYNK